jgi:hypothetical protein
MSKKDKLDFAGVIMLVGFALLLAFNQVVIKITNGGFNRSFRLASDLCWRFSFCLVGCV